MNDFVEGLSEAESIVDVNIAAGSFGDRIRGLGFWQPLFITTALAVLVILSAIVLARVAISQELDRQRTLTYELQRALDQAATDRARMGQTLRDIRDEG